MRNGRSLTLARGLIFLSVCLLAATPGWGKVLFRWTEPTIPSQAATGVKELVVAWDAAALISAARRQGYRVYAEVPVGTAADLAGTAEKSGLAGIILDPGDSQFGQIDEEIGGLRSAFPGLPVLAVDKKAKQPQLKGQLVIKRDGILQVTSPTAQPWIDSNLALIRLDQTFRSVQTPLYEFQWDLSESAQKENGPDTADYALAVAEASAFHADLILDLYPKLQAALAQNDPAAFAVLAQIKRYVAFYDRGDKNIGAPEAGVGVITDTPQKSYEAINLFARHNIPFSVLKAADLKLQDLEPFALLLVFAAPEELITKAITDFASRGGIVVLVGAHGSYPWQSSKPLPAGEHSAAYAAGKGRVIEVQGPIVDPETFAQDIRRLLEQELGKLAISLWNALTVVAIEYGAPGANEKIVELVNYAQDPIPVQVRIKGSYSSVRYESPERACCESLAPAQRGPYTEFVVPSLRIAGRVYLSNEKAVH